MIQVLTSISYECTLLPHFVAYYRSLGIHSFFIVINELVPGIRAETARVAATLPAEIQLVEASPRQRETGIEGANKEEIRRAHVSPGGWIIPADLDEFIQYPAPLPELVAELVAANASYIMGRFHDRVAMDGTLTSTVSTASLWEQYPVQCHISKMLVKCCIRKVVLCRSECELAPGHHDVVTPCRPLETRSAVVHHFKWRKGLPEALRRRVQIYDREGFACAGESRRVLDYLDKNGRIVPAHFRPRMGWKPGDPEEQRRSVVYTAVSAGYDELNRVPATLAPAQCVAFLQEASEVDGWTVAPLHREFSDPCRNAKMHKILPHRFFPEAEYSLWIDGSVTIRYAGKLNALMEQFLGEHDLAVFRHRTRRCIYEEALACARFGKDDRSTIFQQMGRYSKEGYPRRAGLAECCVLLRRHTPEMEAFNEAWWAEICRGSKRDQLSFNYVARKLKFQYRLLPGHIASNAFFARGAHLSPVIPSASSVPAESVSR